MERLSMQQVREILRLRWALGLGVRQTARGLSVGRSVVSKTTTRAATAGLTWEAVQGLDDAELETRVYGQPEVRGSADRPEPDCAWIHTELRHKGVTLELLHLEYLEEHSNGYRYTAFCDRYRRWLKSKGLSMRQVHRAGEKVFVDYSGARPCITDPTTGEKTPVELFVGVLGASSYTFAEATRSQTLPDWCGSHQRMLEFFGGVPEIVVPDQLRSAVQDPCRYDPERNRTYLELARHYGTAVVPARPRKPKDKAKAERGVQVAQRWILARLRHETFFSLADLNMRIAELLADLNARPMRTYGGQSRRELFERLDRPALKPLPAHSYCFSSWSKARVNLDYHIEVEHHYYSVPYALVREVVDVRVTATMVEVLHKNRVITSHARSHQKYQATTKPEHMPPDHKAWLEQDAAGVLKWGSSVGPMTEAMVRHLLTTRPVAQQGLRSAMGLRRVGEQHEPARVEVACEKALRFGARSYRPVANMLKLRREGEANPVESESRPIQHGNVRGPDYFN